MLTIPFSSEALFSDGLNSAFDVVSGIIVIIGARLASLLVCLFIIRTAYLTFREAITQMIDQSCDEEMLSELKSCILSTDGVLGVDLLQVRMFGNRYYVELVLFAPRKTLAVGRGLFYKERLLSQEQIQSILQANCKKSFTKGEVLRIKQSS